MGWSRAFATRYRCGPARACSAGSAPLHPGRHLGENVKRRRFLLARDPFRRIAGSFRRVLLGPNKRAVAKYETVRSPRVLEGLRHIADINFNVDVNIHNILQALLFQCRNKTPQHFASSLACSAGSWLCMNWVITYDAQQEIQLFNVDLARV